MDANEPNTYTDGANLRVFAPLLPIFVRIIQLIRKPGFRCKQFIIIISLKMNTENSKISKQIFGIRSGQTKA